MSNFEGKRQRRKLGDFVEIALGDGYHCYARVLKEILAFYDSRSKEALSPEEIQKRPILFKVAVMDHAIKRGRWNVVGNLPLEDDLLTPPKFFIQDPLNLKSFSLYVEGKITRATRDECEGLERTAVWEPNHVEDRLRDHYAGKPNKWVESLKIRESK